MISNCLHLLAVHDLAGGTEPLSHDLDGGSLRDVFKNGNRGVSSAHPIQAIDQDARSAWNGRQEVTSTQPDCRQDMGETNDLSETMPEKALTMAQDLDAYLEKVGVWGVQEACDTRQDELQSWINRDEKRISILQEQLSDASLNSDQLNSLKQELTTTIKNISKH